MFIAKQALVLVLVAAGVVFVVRAVRPPSVLGRAGPAPPCDIPIEVAGQGVVCVARADAVRRGLRAGAGMRPQRLAAWGAPVALNQATVEELASLEGIGPKLAARIAAARPFRSVEEVARVRGVGRRRVARLRPRLVLDGTPSDGVSY